jgi:CBS-domain-containing membrane protein
MTNYEQFIILCNKFTRLLSDTYDLKSTSTMGQVIRILRHRHPLIKQHFEALDSYSDLRNVLVHEKYDRVVLAQPSDHVIRHFQWIYESLLTPVTLKDLMEKEVITIDANASFKSLLELIKKHGFTHYPIFEDGIFLGVFTDSGVTHTLAQTPFEQLATIYQTPIKSLIQYDEHINDVLVVLQKDSIFDVFDALQQNNKNIETILIVTQTLLQHENQIKGLIVSKALTKILETYILGPQ